MRWWITKQLQIESSSLEEHSWVFFSFRKLSTHTDKSWVELVLFYSILTEDAAILKEKEEYFMLDCPPLLTVSFFEPVCLPSWYIKQQLLSVAICQQSTVTVQVKRDVDSPEILLLFAHKVNATSQRKPLFIFSWWQVFPHSGMKKNAKKLVADEKIFVGWMLEVLA